MEDFRAAVLSLDEESENSNAFFAVYDGHGGRSQLLLKG
jgi:protein phosphatase 2C family protein 2/3